MAKKASKPEKKRTAYGVKPVLVYVDDDMFASMRQLCFDRKLKHSAWIRGLIFKELQDESYLSKTVK